MHTVEEQTREKRPPDSTDEAGKLAGATVPGGVARGD